MIGMFVLFLPIAVLFVCFFFQAEDGIRDVAVTGVQTCALPILNAVRTGLGRSLLPCRIGDGVPEVCRLSGPKPVLSREMWLIVHPDLKHLARVRAVIAWIERLFSERPVAPQTELTDARRRI